MNENQNSQSEDLSYNEPTMLDAATCIADCITVVATHNDETNELRSQTVKGHIISNLEPRTGVATFTLSAVKECGVQISVPFWAVVDMIKAQLSKTVYEGEDKPGKEAEQGQKEN